MSKDYEFIIKDLESSMGGDNVSRFYLTIQPENNKNNKAIVKLEIMKRFPIKDIKKAKALYEKIQQFHYDLEKIVTG